MTLRVVRVRPDLPAIDRSFDYLVPDALAHQIEVGAIVRIPLHGRRVRGWVVQDFVEPETEISRILPLLKVVGAGPPPEILDLGRWAAHRWIGPDVSFFGSASAPNAVVPNAVVPNSLGSAFTGEGVSGIEGVSGARVRVIAWPPSMDRRPLIDRLLPESGSSIVIVPDVGRLNTLIKYLTRAGRSVHVMHTSRSAAERTLAWSEARKGNCVIVGGRGAVWAPVPDLAAIIVLDESDDALQEERSPTWHARDVAIERARRAGVECTLVAAIPSAVAVSLVDHVERPERSEERDGWAHVEVVDLRDEAPGQGLLTDVLARSLHRCVDAGERALLVMNRKGRARLLACGVCRELARCEGCGAAVVEVQSEVSADSSTSESAAAEASSSEVARSLLCPVCATARPWLCVGCGSTRLRVLRSGVSRVRDDVAALLPRSTVLDVDASTEVDLAALKNADVLVGTEAVLHRAPRDRPVGLVAFLDLDQELLAPRHRAAEQSATLLARSARLLGQRSASRSLLLQTRLPDHDVIRAVSEADPSIAWIAEINRRKSLHYPPFGALAQLRGVEAAVEYAASMLRSLDGVTVLGPVASGASFECLIRCQDSEALSGSLLAVLAGARALGRMRVEVDPARV
jgi:primosomal protein N' (replication factor Y)